MSICKRIGAVLLSVFVVLQLTAIGAAAYTDPMESILGVYEGYYYAHQGQTGVTLSVYFMAKNGIINGIGDNKFAPKNSTTAQAAAGYANATRQQALLISDRTFNKLG